MTAAPKPVRPMRKFSVYEMEHAGRILTFDAAEVDKNGGLAKFGGLTFTIQWRPEATAA